VRLAKKRAGLDHEEGRWLLRAIRFGTHLRLGYGSFHEYAERLFGYAPRLTQEKLRIAEALEELPEMTNELRQGSLSFSAVRELTRVATARTEREWLAAAKDRSVREVERLVSGHRPGSRPGDVPEPGAKRHVLRLEVSGEVLATFREAIAKIRRDAGGPIDDDAAVLLLARHVLEGPREQGRASYQVALTVCEGCRTGKQHGRGELVEVPPEVVEMADCDGQDVGSVTDGADHVTDGRESGHGAGAHVGAPKLPRATQSIPPALRRAVLRRDGGRCRVPGCRHATFVDVHHLVPRSSGGRHSAENLVTLCSAHHRAIHRGELETRGAASRDLHFFHGDGRAYGGAPVPALAEMRAKARRALTLMGYSETEAKWALGRLPIQHGTTLEALVREGLRELGS
jgi:5-methylcytosine-specific restriction endonuclease McrA